MIIYMQVCNIAYSWFDSDEFSCWILVKNWPTPDPHENSCNNRVYFYVVYEDNTLLDKLLFLKLFIFKVIYYIPYSIVKRLKLYFILSLTCILTFVEEMTIIPPIIIPSK